MLVKTCACGARTVLVKAQTAGFSADDYWQCRVGHREPADIEEIRLEGHLTQRGLHINGTVLLYGVQILPGVWMSIEDGSIVVEGAGGQHRSFESVNELQAAGAGGDWPEQAVADLVTSCLSRYHIEQETRA